MHIDIVLGITIVLCVATLCKSVVIKVERNEERKTIAYARLVENSRLTDLEDMSGTKLTRKAQ